MKRFLLAAALLALLPAAWAIGPSGYEVTGRIDLPGATRWDQVRFDPKDHRLYIAQSPVVTVLDTDTGKIVGTIPDAQTAHDVAIDHDLHLGFFSAGRKNVVGVFDLATLKPQGEIKSEGDPHKLFYDERSKRLLVVGDRTRSIDIIDPKTRRSRGKLSLEGPPQEMVSGRDGNVYVNVMYDDSLVGINPRTARQVSQSAFKQCHQPSGLAMDPQGRMFSACRDGKLVVSSPQGKTLQEIELTDPRWSGGIDGAVWQDGHLFISNGRNGTVVVVDETQPDHFEVVESIPTSRGARALAGDPEHHRLYSVTADIDPTTPWEMPRALPDSLHVVVIERQP